MHASKLLLAVILLFSVAVRAADPGGSFIPVRGLEIEGFIIPKSMAKALSLPFDKFWTPSERDIEELERRLPTYLQKELRAAPERATLAEIVKNLRGYRRQYLGVVREQRQLVLLNCLPPKPANDSDIFENWDRNLIEVSDGGSEHWSAFYDVRTRTFKQLNVHGKG